MFLSWCPRVPRRLFRWLIRPSAAMKFTEWLCWAIAVSLRESDSDVGLLIQLHESSTLTQRHWLKLLVLPNWP